MTELDKLRDGKWHTINYYDTGFEFAEGPGVYAAFYCDKLIYVGQSGNVMKRRRKHESVSSRKDTGDNGYVSWHGINIPVRSCKPFGFKWKFAYEKNYRLRCKRESRLISRLSPPGNTRGVTT